MIQSDVIKNSRLFKLLKIPLKNLLYKNCLTFYSNSLFKFTCEFWNHQRGYVKTNCCGFLRGSICGFLRWPRCIFGGWIFWLQCSRILSVDCDQKFTPLIITVSFVPTIQKRLPRQLTGCIHRQSQITFISMLSFDL